ncbi:unnamed protein product (macronuclear) [Paramecium tetraurelia]|uniref:Uncharacterized protein n=1 Tax=Paramecium tetraurelia TaxID=5888 RepID=A0DIJ4_PARTE|nr:uncharacterized protein GSPATT00017218001 [Paramecium tetraurelia]CAK82861.1 unnamed protein product [Paramecium tetraurelia]|eukprot:XP_001450258.1 hypothetical protein (macronuclear) [Paramecium tetraurelia strain d4-2]
MFHFKNSQFNEIFIMWLVNIDVNILDLQITLQTIRKNVLNQTNNIVMEVQKRHNSYKICSRNILICKLPEVSKVVQVLLQELNNNSKNYCFRFCNLVGKNIMIQQKLFRQFTRTLSKSNSELLIFNRKYKHDIGNLSFTVLFIININQMQKKQSQLNNHKQLLFDFDGDNFCKQVVFRAHLAEIKAYIQAGDI